MKKNQTILKKKINFYRYRTGDFDLKRDSDIELYLNVEAEYHSSYIHTHRYFFSFLDFWMNFAELQDRVFKQNMHSIDKVIFFYIID